MTGWLQSCSDCADDCSTGGPQQDVCSPVGQEPHELLVERVRVHHVVKSPIRAELLLEVAHHLSVHSEEHGGDSEGGAVEHEDHVGLVDLEGHEVTHARAEAEVCEAHHGHEVELEARSDAIVHEEVAEHLCKCARGQFSL